jgi:hypothetical protein
MKLKISQTGLKTKPSALWLAVPASMKFELLKWLGRYAPWCGLDLFVTFSVKRKSKYRVSLLK